MKWKCTYCRDCTCIVDIDIDIEPKICPFVNGYKIEPPLWELIRE